jgi:hypothetical protein
MNINKGFFLAGAAILAATLAHGGITYTCDPSVTAATCNYLNTTIAGQYNSTFSNANATIYVQYGTTGLAQSTTGYDNQVSYANYVAALAANTNMSTIDQQALLALAANDFTPYGSGNVDITSALASALGIAGEVINGNTGITGPGGSPCTAGSLGCYNGVITMSNAPNTWYYDNLGGTETGSQYDFYGALEHETDEILGTSSCINTTGVSLNDGCPGASTPSAADLFRYSAPGSLILDSSPSTTPGAYFSYNGGTTNGAIGIGGSPKFYNTLNNGDDYADYISSSPDCGTNQAVQDAEGCPGEDAGVNILNDGGSEINVLNAVGYDLKSSLATPEPGTMGLLGAGLTMLAFVVRRRR